VGFGAGQHKVEGILSGQGLQNDLPVLKQQHLTRNESALIRIYVMVLKAYAEDYVRLLGRLEEGWPDGHFGCFFLVLPFLRPFGLRIRVGKGSATGSSHVTGSLFLLTLTGAYASDDVSDCVLVEILLDLTSLGEVHGKCWFSIESIHSQKREDSSVIHSPGLPDNKVGRECFHRI